MPDVGTQYAAIAAIPKATEPTRFAVAITDSRLRARTTEEAAGALPVREAARDEEANGAARTSGVHTSRLIL